MAAGTALRHKHIRIDQAKLDKARKVLKTSTETETLDRALSVVVAEAQIDSALRSGGGKAEIRKVFR
jgi:hypothetical protein